MDRDTGHGRRVIDNMLPLGTVPAEEAAARPGDSNYSARAFAECRRFITLLRRTLGPEPAGATLSVRRSEQDFDPYLEVVVRFDDASDVARAYALRCEREAPSRWDAVVAGQTTELP